MDSNYENSSFLLSTFASGNSTEVQKSEKHRSRTWTKVLLIGLAVALVFALGGLCYLAILYVNVSVQLSAQKTNGKIMAREMKGLRVNYTRAKEDLRINHIMTRQLTANFTRVKEQLSLCEDELILLQKTRQSQSVACDSSWADFQGKLYFFSNDELTWSSSRDFCVSKGADLVTITSKEEQIFLHSKINSWSWIGLNDLETEGRWVWVNGKTLNETGVQFWYQRKSQKSEPDNWKEDDSSGENCAIVKDEQNSLTSWFDVSCKYDLKFICEKINTDVSGTI